MDTNRDWQWTPRAKRIAQEVKDTATALMIVLLMLLGMALLTAWFMPSADAATQARVTAYEPIEDASTDTPTGVDGQSITYCERHTMPDGRRPWYIETYNGQTMRLYGLRLATARNATGPVRITRATLIESRVRFNIRNPRAVIGCQSGIWYDNRMGTELTLKNGAVWFVQWRVRDAYAR